MIRPEGVFGPFIPWGHRPNGINGPNTPDGLPLYIHDKSIKYVVYYKLQRGYVH